MKKILILIALLLVALGLFIIYKNNDEPQKSTGNNQVTNQSITNTQSFDKSKNSIDDATSIWVVVNKQRPLPAGYTPNDLTYVSGEQVRSVAAGPLNNLIAAARKDGINLSILSAFRSYDYQKNLYNSYVSKDGVSEADRYSARPGHSEHQTGLAVDLGNGQCDLQTCFGETPAGKWLQKHSYEYGFIIRYGKGQENLTSYQYEPWHLRYVGADLAYQLQTNSQTLEQFFGLEPATSY